MYIQIGLDIINLNMVSKISIFKHDFDWVLSLEGGKDYIIFTKIFASKADAINYADIFLSKIGTNEEYVRVEE